MKAITHLVTYTRNDETVVNLTCTSMDHDPDTGIITFFNHSSPVCSESIDDVEDAVISVSPVRGQPTRDEPTHQGVQALCNAFKSVINSIRPAPYRNANTMLMLLAVEAGGMGEASWVAYAIVLGISALLLVVLFIFGVVMASEPMHHVTEFTDPDQDAEFAEEPKAPAEPPRVTLPLRKSHGLLMPVEEWLKLPR